MLHILFYFRALNLDTKQPQKGHELADPNSIQSRFSRSVLKGGEMTLSIFVWVEGDSKCRSIVKTAVTVIISWQQPADKNTMA